MNFQSHYGRGSYNNNPFASKSSVGQQQGPEKKSGWQQPALQTFSAQLLSMHRPKQSTPQTEQPHRETGWIAANTFDTDVMYPYWAPPMSKPGFWAIF